MIVSIFELLDGYIENLKLLKMKIACLQKLRL